MLTSATVAHYKSLQEANLRFGKRNVIVGPNGSGKSNILDAIYFVHDCASSDIDTAVTKRHGIDSIRQWSRTRPFNITIDLSFSNEVGRGNYKVVISSAKGNYRIVEESGSWIGPSPRDRIYVRERTAGGQEPKTHNSFFRRLETGTVEVTTTIKDPYSARGLELSEDDLFITALASRSSVSTHPQFRPLAEEIVSFSKYNIYPNTLREPQLVSRDNVLSENGSNLASILKTINSNKRYAARKDDILSAVQVLMPMVTDFQVRSAAGYYVPVLRVKEQNGDVHDFNLSQISDGTLRTLGLLAAFYQPNAPSKIGVEEPEQMIHPGALSVFKEAVDSFVDRNNRQERQVFITTHSPTLLDLFEANEIIWAKFRRGVTECGHVGKRQMELIKEHLFSAGELLVAEGISD